MNSHYAFHNWDHTLTCQPRRYLQPASEAEVCDIVRTVSRAHGTLRVVGAGHSWSPLVLTDDILLNLDRLNQLVRVDQDQMRVTAGAGIRLKELNELLPRYGLALANLGSIAEQSIAGAISTGTHGTGLRLGNLATQIIALNLVTRGGDLIHVSMDSEPGLMSAACVSLGALGVITQVTIQCVPAHHIRLRAEPQRFEEVLERIDRLNAENERVRLYWFTGTDIFYVTTLNPTDVPETPPRPLADWFNNVALRQYLMSFLLHGGNRAPAFADDINRFQAKVGFKREEWVARSDRALTIAMPPLHQEMEYAIPVEKTVEALRLTRRLVETRHIRANVPLEVRFVAADQNMLSPAYGRDTCYLGAYTYGEHSAQTYFAEFEAAMKKLNGRPHWGKHLTLTAAEAREIYARFDEFNAIRRELDPSGVFANEMIRGLFG